MCYSSSGTHTHKPRRLYTKYGVRRRQWQPTPVLLPGKSHGWRSLVGCSLWGHGVGHDWVTSLSLFTFMHWRGKLQPTPVFLPGEPRNGGAWWAAFYGSYRVGHDWSDLAGAAAHASKVMLKILQASLQQYVKWELPDVQTGFWKGIGTRAQITNIY